MAKNKNSNRKDHSTAVHTDYTIYSDGGCKFNPGGPGGYGTVVLDNETGEFWEYSEGFIKPG